MSKVKQIFKKMIICYSIAKDLDFNEFVKTCTSIEARKTHLSP